MIFWRLVRTVVLALCRVLFRVRIVGREHVPATGAFILAFERPPNPRLTS